MLVLRHGETRLLCHNMPALPYRPLCHHFILPLYVKLKYLSENWLACTYVGKFHFISVDLMVSKMPNLQWHQAAGKKVRPILVWTWKFSWPFWFFHHPWEFPMGVLSTFPMGVLSTQMKTVQHTMYYVICVHNEPYPQRPAECPRLCSQTRSKSTEPECPLSREDPSMYHTHCII